MDGFFIGRILKMSLIGSYCILLVLPLRLFLLKCERKYAYYLWLAVFLNLSVPFAIQGRVSLIPRQVAEFSVTPKEHMDGTVSTKAVENLIRSRDNRMEDEVREEGQSADFSREKVKESPSGANSTPVSDINGIRGNAELYESVGWQQWSIVVFFIWLLGFFGIVVFNLINAFRTGRQISRDKWVCWDSKKRIAQVKGLSSPFLWGIFRPVVFLPAGLKEEERTYIIAHENIHRKRKDPVLKMVFFLVTAVHWFNPVVWAAWALFCRDMEISCDEAVLLHTGENIKRQYAQSLLRFAAAQNGYLMVPLTFGEPSAKMRIKNVLGFRKRNVLITGMAGLVVLIVVLGLTVRPVEAADIFTAALYGGRLGEIGDKEGMVSSADFVAKKNIEEMENARIAKITNKVKHRAGYVEAMVIHEQCTDELYFTPGLRKEEELEALAQRALRELYDLTGYQIESCVYDCTDLGTFYFAKTRKDLEIGNSFYERTFGEEEGYDAMLITSMSIVNARRHSYSDVEQLDVPEDVENMEDAELAVWFLKRSAVYQGEELSGITEPLSYPKNSVKVMTADGSFYEVMLDRKVNGVTDIFGPPYPEGFE